jgi:hypothetical protein
VSEAPELDDSTADKKTFRQFSRIDARGVRGGAFGDNNTVINNPNTIINNPASSSLSASSAGAMGIAVCLLALALVLTLARVGGVVSPIVLGGTWLTPPGGTTKEKPFLGTSSKLLIRVHSVPADLVNHVNFTANWGEGWQSICRVYNRGKFPEEPLGSSCVGFFADSPKGLYGVNWDMGKSGAPVGVPIRISFDVYGSHDEISPESQAPDGIHWVEYVSSK